MTEYEKLENQVLEGEISVLDYICRQRQEDGEKDTRGLSPHTVEASYWRFVQKSQEEGKKLVAFSGGVPVELIYASGCVPLCLDLIPIALSKSVKLTSKFMYDTDVHINSALCSHSKSMLGAALFEKGGISPDAFVYTPIACPSGSTAAGAYRTHSELPVFYFDPPTDCTEISMKLCSQQVSGLMGFLEGISGQKLDFDLLCQNMENVNEAKRLLEKCSLMRQKTPCPMSSHIQEISKLMPALAPKGLMKELLTKELETLEDLAQKGEGPCPEGEKHRIFMLQMPLWCADDLTSWLEEKYGAVTVMDGLGYEMGTLYENMDTLEDCFLELSRTVFYPPSLHGAASASRRLIDLSTDVVRDYGVDVCVFLGSVGCRHTWALSKMLTDIIRDDFGVPTLFADVDSVDTQYKDINQIKTQVAEFMDSVVLGK